MTLGQSFDSVLEAAKLGAEWAWGVLYGEIAGPVTGFFRTRGVADPEGAAGDVFIELSRGLQSFEGSEEAFHTLVFVIAYKRLMVEKRYSTGRAHSVLADQVLDRLQQDVEQLVNASVSETPGELRKALEVLSSDQRDVLSLRIVGGLSLDQTAKVVGRSVQAVKTAQRRGLSKVRRTIPGQVALT